METPQRALSVALFGLLLSVLPLSGQTAQQPGTAFDVVSVKPNTSSDLRSSNRLLPGSYSVANVPLLRIIMQAYDVQPFVLLNGPAWLNDRFDINARVSGNPSQDQMLRMIQTLLADRFQLRVHTESREMPIYALMIANPSKGLGPKLRPSAADCTSASGSEPPRQTAPLPQSELPPCGRIRVTPSYVASRGGVRLDKMAYWLSILLDRTVKDRTGLTEDFAFELAWEPLNAGGVSDGPSLFTAIQEQLGLKLESTRGPVDVLVIDQIAHPTEN